MKRFAFPLARVLDWRRTQAQVEESKLASLYAELIKIEARLAETQSAREHSKRKLLAVSPVLGFDLSALDRFQNASAAECVRLAELAAAARQRIATQLAAVVQSRRDVRLLELLQADKLAAWKAARDKESDQDAAELYLVKFAAGSLSQAGIGNPDKIEHGP